MLATLLQIPKDVWSQWLTVCRHSVGLSTKSEQELGLGLESMVKMIDPSPLPIPDRQSKMLGWVWGLKKLSKTLRSWEGAMAMSWSNLWVLFTPYSLQGSRSSDSIFWVGPSSWNPEKTVDKFAGSLIFWVGLSLQNPNKNLGKSEFRIILDKPILQNPKKPRGNPHFENFLGPLKTAGNRGKIRILKPVHRGKMAKNFWTSPSFKIPRHRGKSVFWEFFGSP